MKSQKVLSLKFGSAVLATAVALTSLPTLSQAQSAGDVRKFGSMEFVWCPAGQFTMGSPSDEKDRSSNEKSRKVTLSSGFWMARCEVSQKQFREVMNSNPSLNQGPNLPVENVTWEEAQQFVSRLNENHSSDLPGGFRFALPSEAQWEYACRAGSSRKAGGESELREKAWFKSNSQGSSKLCGEKRANAWGIFDIQGNVWEWCNDWFADYSSSAETDPEGPSFGKMRVYRGGSYGSFAKHCRAAYRGRVRPSFRDSFIGIRVAVVPN